MKKDVYADYILKNGKIITVNSNDDICEAIAVQGNKIVCVGKNEQAEEYI